MPRGALTDIEKRAAQRIRHRRKELFMTLERLATLTEKTHQHISQIETQKVSITTPEFLDKIATALNVSVSYFFEENVSDLVNNTPQEGKDDLTRKFLKAVAKLPEKEQRLLQELTRILSDAADDENK
jgi:transcriptional regulator with XRE-family HTH domain